MSFDLYGMAEQNAAENQGEIDPFDPLAPMRVPGGVRLGGNPLPGQKAPKSPAGAPRRPFAQQPAHGAPMNFGLPIANPGVLSPDQQADHLQGMANGVMRAFRDENDSRVAQARELLRRQHEQEMEDKANEADLQKEAMRRDALLVRLGKQDAFRVWDPSTLGWKYIDEVRFG